jgi:uncharacterized phage protein (TIGR02216 family)
MFGEAAARLCGMASLLLGWRPDEFWKATPAELVLALQLNSAVAEVPERGLIEELKRRFPDGVKATNNG